VADIDPWDVDCEIAVVGRLLDQLRGRIEVARLIAANPGRTGAGSTQQDLAASSEPSWLQGRAGAALKAEVLERDQTFPAPG